MALTAADITRLNPWWADPTWAAHDPHLTAIPAAVTLPDPTFVSGIALGDRSVHVVRGPRQVGKSTGLKRLVERALADGAAPSQVVYLSLDLLEGASIAAFATAVRRAKELAASDGPSLILLDEVTVVMRWARAVKELWDAGDIRNDTVVCTGSSAIDLADGEVESLPGRRGAGSDFLVLPQSFASFARAGDPLIPASPSLRVGALSTPEGRETLRQAQKQLPRLGAALDRYLVFGGLPAAVVEAASGAARPSASTQRVLWDSISREVRRRGASEPALRALLERVVLGLSSKTSWSTLAREMDAPLGGKNARVPPDGKTVKDYVEFLGRNYVLLVAYFWKAALATNDQAHDKKIYLGDPLLHTIVLDRTPGLAFDKAKAVENAVALALYRIYEPEANRAEGFAYPEELHAWETTKPREIDFVCGRRPAAELVEVKYQSRAGAGDTLVMRNAFPGRPAVLATRDTFALEDDYLMLPAELLLWVVGG